MRSFMFKLGEAFFSKLDRPGIRVLLLGIICIAGLVLGQSLGDELVYDSVIVLNDDTRIQAFAGENLVDVFTRNYWWPSAQSDLYRPITTLSFLINKVVFGAGQNPIPYQLFNIALHLLNAILAFSLVLRLGVQRWVAFFSVVLFVVHPSLSEVVPNIVGRADLLANCAILVGFHLYLFAREIKRPSVLWGVFAVGLLGVYSKESGVSLGALILLHGLLFPRRIEMDAPAEDPGGLKDALSMIYSERKFILRLSTLAFGLVICAMLPKLLLRGPEFNPESALLDNPLMMLGFWMSRINAVAVLGQMCTAVLAPWRLAPDYSYDQIPLLALETGGIQNLGNLVYVGVVIFMVAGFFFAWAKGRRLLAFSVGAGFLCLLPTANIFVLIGTIRADRFMYFSNLWFGLAAALVVHDVYLRVVRRQLSINPWVILPAFYLAALALLTFFRCSDWQTNRQFWQSAYETSPNSFRACLGYGSVLSRNRDLGEFLLSNQLLDRAHEILGKTDIVSDMSLRLIADAKARWGKVLAENGRLEEAAFVWSQADQVYSKIITFRSAYHARAAEGIDRAVTESVIMDATIGKSLIALEQNRLAEAEALLNSITKWGAADIEYLTLRSRLSARSGDWARARLNLTCALLLDDSNVITLENLSYLINDRLPPRWSLVDSDSSSGSPPFSAINVSDPELRSLVIDAADTLMAYYRAQEDTLSVKQLVRKVRHRIGIINYEVPAAG